MQLPYRHVHSSATHLTSNGRILFGNEPMYSVSRLLASVARPYSLPHSRYVRILEFPDKYLHICDSKFIRVLLMPFKCPIIGSADLSLPLPLTLCLCVSLLKTRVLEIYLKAESVQDPVRVWPAYLLYVICQVHRCRLCGIY